MASHASLRRVLDEDDRLVLTEALTLYAGALDRRQLVWLSPRDPIELRDRVDNLLTRLHQP
jgi:hypothetical protein